MQITQAGVCFHVPAAKLQNMLSLYNTFISDWKTESVWVMLSSVLQRNAVTSNQTVRSAAGPEGKSDGGRILLLKVMGTFETTSVSHWNNPTCFSDVQALYPGPQQAASNVCSQRSACCRLICTALPTVIFYCNDIIIWNLQQHYTHVVYEEQTCHTSLGESVSIKTV